MTPNLTTTNNFYYESLNYHKNEPLDLTLNQKLSDAHISKKGKEKLSLAPKKLLKPSETPSLDSEGISTTSATKNNGNNSKKQSLFLTRKWVKSHFRMSREATLSFYTICMAYNQFCNEKNELPIPPMDLLNILNFEFIQDDSELHEDEKKQDISSIRNLKSVDSLFESEIKTSTTLQQEYGDISFDNLKFRCISQKTQIEDDYSSDSSDSALSSLDYEHENKEYQNDGYKNSSDKDSSYESLDESSNGQTTSFASKNLQEGTLKPESKNAIHVLCISSPNHVNKGIQIKASCDKASRNEIKIIRLSSTKDYARINKEIENTDADFINKKQPNKKEVKLEAKKQVLQATSCEEIRIKREREEEVETELGRKQSEGKRLKLQYNKPEDVVESGPKSQKIGIQKDNHPLNQVQWSRSQELIIEGITKVLSLQGFEDSPCYKDAKGFAQAFIEMLRNKQLKKFLSVFAHAMTCKDNHKGLCYMFKRIAHHITRAQHNCAVKCVYAHVLRLHLDTCESNNCGFRECGNLRQMRKNIMASAAPQEE